MEAKRTIVIPCAGQSSRMNFVPKNMLVVGGKTVLQHIIEQWAPLAKAYVFVLRRDQTYLWPLLPKNSAVVFQDEPLGLADAILRAESFITGNFIIALGDCLTVGEFASAQVPLGVGVVDAAGELDKSYVVHAIGDRVRLMKEKPHAAGTIGFCGMGTYFMDRTLFTFIRSFKGTRGFGGDLTAIIQSMVDAGYPVQAVRFKGVYVNINSPEDITKAEWQLGGVR